MDLLAETKLCIVTSNGTTYLESLFMNVPTVIFWDTAVWEIVESAVPYFDDLMRVGIFHDSPESAASHVSRIWCDVGSWWNDPDVREAVEAFSVQFCRRSPDVVDEVRRVLVEVGGRR
jgi:putative transferase (TIGR04331 family)